MRRVSAAAWVGIVAAAGCSKKTQDGLPPATEWQASETARPTDEPPLERPRGMGGAAAANPHAGFAMGAGSNPHAGGEGDDDDSDPHAGLDMSNPHAGLGGGTDVTKLGLAAPDPDRKIDPSHRIAGIIMLDAKTKATAKPGTSVFLIVKRAGPDGAPSGPPLAVDKLSWALEGIAFELTDAQAMVAGTELAGDVVVMARYDQDADALTKQHGDLTGQARVKIPAENVKIVLDTVLP